MIWTPPYLCSMKVPNLVYLLNKIGIKPPETIARHIIKLNEASVVTRYPEDLNRLQRYYTGPVTKEILTEGKGILKWIKSQF